MNQNKIAIITGSSRGVGRGIAYRLAENGFKIVVNFAQDAEGAEETAVSIRERGGESMVVQADIGYSDQVDHLFSRVAGEWGIPNVLVNNAGIQTWKPFLEVEESDWDRTLRTNLKGAFLCSQRAAREMQKVGGGRIVNIGSGCNKGPFPGLVGYSVSKGGVELLTRVAAVELGPFGITVNCVAPGPIEIERTQLETRDYHGTWAPLIPLRRVGQVQDVAGAVAFLISDDAAFVNGQTIYIDGGLFTQFPWPYE